MGIDAVLRRRDRPGTGPQRESLRDIAVVFGVDEMASLLQRMQGRMPVLSRLDPVRSVVMTSADMPELISELDQTMSGAISDPERQFLSATRALADVCACDRSLELHFDGD
jgi:hypothetical protein